MGCLRKRWLERASHWIWGLIGLFGAGGSKEAGAYTRLHAERKQGASVIVYLVNLVDKEGRQE